MRNQNKLRIQRGRRRKYFWLFAAAAVATLVWQEQVAAIFVLSTLAICGLLLVVSFSNLEARDVEMQASAIKETANDVTTNSRDLSREERRAA